MKKQRKTVPLRRSNDVYCLKCSKQGHYTGECPGVSPRQVRYVEEEEEDSSSFYIQYEGDKDAEEDIHGVPGSSGAGTNGGFRKAAPTLARPPRVDAYQQGAGFGGQWPPKP